MFIELRQHWQFAKNIPGPNFLEVLPNIKTDRFIFWMRELRDKYGPLFKVWIGKELFLIASDPDDMRTLMSSNELLYKSKGYKLLEPWLGRGLLTNGGSDWHRRRKMLTPAFHFKISSAFQQPMEENCKILIRKLNSVADGQSPVNIYPFISLFTLDVICETAMGVKQQAQLKSDSEYVNAVRTICDIIQNRFLSVIKRYDIFYKYTQSYKESEKALDVLHGETKRVIELRRKLLQDADGVTLNKIESDEAFNNKRRLAFLDILLMSQNEGVPITNKEIQEEVDTFMFEGHDTTSSAISFTIYLLSQHREIQEKVYEEVIRQSESYDGKEPMKYLEAVIKESLRLYPPVPNYSRITNEDFMLRDKKIPKGITIVLFTFLAHRNPKEYPDPDKFIPERFLDGTKDKEFHPFAFTAFSAGPRNCIGQRFAMLELKCTLSNLIKEFEFLPVDDFNVKPISQLVLKSSNGILVKIRARKEQSLIK